MIYAIVDNELINAEASRLLLALAHRMATKNAHLRVVATASSRKIAKSAQSANGDVELFCAWKSAKLANELLINAPLAIATCKRYVKGFGQIKRQQQLLVAAYVPVLLGATFKEPIEVIFLYHKDSKSKVYELIYKIAAAYSIRVYNLANADDLQKVKQWVE